jgi:sigma-B regulation protein RsbU (phosphoserine phosphatase)
MLGACGLLHAQKFDLTNGRMPLVSLDGLWRFHTGDNSAWADPNFDDSKWSLLRSDREWSSQGYPDYGGLAWYRFQVVVPAGMDHVSLLLPHISTCYEVFADGKLVGTYGKMPPNRMPYGGGAYFQAFSLPAAQQTQRNILIAIRVWHWPGWVKYGGGGPSSGDGLVGDSKLIENYNYVYQAAMFIWSANSEIVGLLETLAGIGALILFLLRLKEREYLWFSLMMLLSAANHWIDTSLGFRAWNIEIHDLIVQTAGAGADLASIFFFLKLLQPKRTWLLKAAVVSIALHQVDAFTGSLSGSFLGVWFDTLVVTLCSLVLYAWIITVVFTGARQKSVDARLLIVPVSLSALVNLLDGVAWMTFTLGWQHKFGSNFILIHDPFQVSLGDAVEVLFLLAVFGILVLRFTRTRSQEERFASEVQAAQEVQQYFIPAQLPAIPGFKIESAYRPAREVGGDFFQVLPHAEDGSVLIVVGDVAGKGLQAGMLATLIVGAVRTAAKFTTDPIHVMALLNERLQGRGLVTCMALNFERDGNVTLVNAGHLPPYLNGNELQVDGSLPLGAIAEAEFPVVHFKLAEGDSLMLMSDGIAEAQDAHGHLFGFDKIGEMMRQRATAAGLASAAQDFGQEDDITVLTVARMTPALAG